MSQHKSIFYQHWRDCLQQHFLYVVRTHDAVTEPTLRQVLKSTGFTEAELEALYETGLRQREEAALLNETIEMVAPEETSS